MDEAESAKMIQSLLQEAGYKAQLLEDNAVGSAASGLKFLVLPYPNSIQFRCGVRPREASSLGPDFVNEMNKTLRFLKVFMGDDGDMVMESDWLIDLSSSNAAEQFSPAMDLWELSLARLVERIRATPDAEVV